MKLSKPFLTIACIFCLISCIGRDYVSNKVISPSGKYYFISTVNRSDNSKDDYADVIISLYSADEELISKVNTNAGDANSWAVGWENEKDIVILNSSDIGFRAWKFENNQFIEIELTADLIKQAEAIKQEK